MRVLIVAFSYAPTNNPRAFRWTELAEYWVAQGIQVDVITAWAPARARAETRNGVSVYRVGGSIIERLRAVLAPSRSLVAVATTSPNTPGLLRTIASKLGTAIAWLHDHTWRKVYWPDYAGLWYFAAARRAMALTYSHGYDAMITVSLPFTGHLVGWSVKRAYPALSWLVDVGDPFCFSEATPHNNRWFYRRFDHRVERALFRRADAVTVTTGRTRARYAELFPESASKLKVVPPLLPVQDTGKATMSVANGEKRRLVYTGTFYRAIRNPDTMLQVFDAFLDANGKTSAELHVFGALNDCREYFARYQALIGRQIILHGVVGRDTVINAMANATALINIGNDNSFQLPSKVLEYAASGRPIINFVTDPEDCSIDLLKLHPACLTLGPDTVGIAAKAAALRQFLHVHGSSAIGPLAWLDEYRIPNISARYLALLQVRKHVPF